MNIRVIALLAAASVAGPVFADGRSVAAIAEALVGDDAMARRAASREACLHPLDADALLPALTRGSADADAVVALRCRATVRLMRAARSGELPDLRERLRSGTREARIAALDEARRMGAAAAPAVAELVAALASDSREIRDAAAAALGDIGPAAADAVPALITVYEATHGDYVVTQALDGIGTGLVQATPLLLEEMKSNSASVRAAVIQRIGRNGPAGPEVVGVVRGLLDDDDATLRGCAMFVLAETAPTDPATVEALVAGAVDRVPRVRELSVRSLGDLGAFAAAAAPTLTRALADNSADVRREAAKSLSRVLPRDGGAPDALVALLSDADAGVLAAALESLARLGPPASTVPALRAIESRGDYATSELARVARWRAGDGDVATLVAVTRDSSEFRAEAAEQLLRLARGPDVPLGAMLAAKRTIQGTGELDAAFRAVGPNAATATNLDALVADARDFDRFEADFALGLLAQLGSAAAPAAPRLVELMRSSVDGRAPAIAAALGAMGRDAAPVAVPALLDALCAPDVDTMTRVASADALSRMGIAALPRLLAILASAPTAAGDERWPPTPAALAARALGGMGAAARTAVPALVARARAGDFAAVEALGGLGSALEAAATPLADLFERTDDELPTKDAPAFRVALVRALGGMKGNDNWRVGRALATAFRSERPLLRVRAAEAQLRLFDVTGAKDERLDVLIEALRSDVTEPATVRVGGPGLGPARQPAVFHPIRRAAAEALAAVGPGAARAGPELIARWLDEDEDVLTRQAAYAAIRRIFGE